ncbi:NAD-dependent epimerase/dehydratase family protein [Phytoactinopolyspora limicola]|uniref:NAD-dependent epimerase/dehydratase family protein n=1 Tax=Phytoactinopolyspora limicola TaxID=2715536 RepID=UPI00140B4F70|nr:NAD(P)-dependent oxidoreductase [Phytoactinopolyspora limicola]
MTVIDHVLITGAAGLIGRATTRHLRQRGTRITGLVLDDPGDLDVDRVVVGDAGDRAAVEAGLDGVDAVIHLAARAAPNLGTADEVFSGNVAATFTVLDAAGERGIRHAAVASSINALGYHYSPHADVHPEWFPLDEQLPSRAADPYSLSKQVDEMTAAGMHRRYGMTIVALRFPMVGGLGEVAGVDGRLPSWAKAVTAEPWRGARDGWLYLESRDAARALELALRPAVPGAHVVFVAAPTTGVPYRTGDLLDRYHPGVPRRRLFSGREAPVDLGRAADLLGFTARHLLPDAEIRSLPPETRSG